MEIDRINSTKHSEPKYKCFKCGGSNHKASECYSKKKFTKNDNGRDYDKVADKNKKSGKKEGKSCYYCGKQNHMWKEYRSRLRDQSKQSGYTNKQKPQKVRNLDGESSEHVEENNAPADLSFLERSNIVYEQP